MSGRAKVLHSSSSWYQQQSKMPQFSSLWPLILQLTYMVRTLFQESKKWKPTMALLRPEPRIHSVLLLTFRIHIASLLLHSICHCKLQSQSISKTGE